MKKIIISMVISIFLASVFIVSGHCAMSPLWQDQQESVLVQKIKLRNVPIKEEKNDFSRSDEDGVGDSFFEDIGVDAKGASVPVDSIVLQEDEKLLAFDGSAQDNFGYDVSISGDTAVVGSPYDDDNGNNSGSVYIYIRNGDVWSFSQKIEEGSAIDYFGKSVAISGDIIIVGAPLDDEKGSQAGAAYIFKKNASGWFKVQKITALDGAAGDEFGTSVAVFGDIAVVGAYLHNDSTSDCGAAYVFKENASGTSWSQADELLAFDGSEDDYFGSSVSVWEDTVVVGSHRDDDNGAESGSAYIFKRNASGLWPFSQKLIVSDGDPQDSFGKSVSIWGDVAVIGSHLDDDQGANAGAAYVFQKNASGVWLETQKIFASDGASGDFFGSAVSFQGDLLAVGARYHNSAGFSDSGSAYIFSSDLSWTELLVASDTSKNDYFGWSVGISDDTAIVGAPQDDDNGSNSGSAYIFTKPTTPILATVSGTILDYYTNQPIFTAQLTAVVDGVTTVYNVPTGSYSFSVTPGANVSLTPSAGNNYTFPLWAGVDNPSWSGVVNADIAKHFLGVNSYTDLTVSGTVKDQNGQAIPTAEITLTLNGATQVFNVPNINYSINANPGDNVSVVPSATGYTFPQGMADNPSWAGMVIANTVKHFIGVIDTFTLTYLAGPGGSISGPTPQTVNYGQDGQEVIAVPDVGYHFVKWSDNVMTPERKELNVQADITVTAYFEVDILTVSGTVFLNDQGQGDVEIVYYDNGSSGTGKDGDGVPVRRVLATTNPDGTYSFSKEYGWSAKVFAEQPGHQFQAGSGYAYWEYINLDQSYINRNYFANDDYTVTGTVFLNNQGQGDVEIVYYDNGSSGTGKDGEGVPVRKVLTITNPDGTYSFSKEYGWSAKVYAQDPGHQYQAANGLMYWEYQNLSQDHQEKDYFAVDLYTLTVNNGTGSGQYEANIVVPIAANPAPTGYEFDQWVGDISYVSDPMSSSTEVTMPANDVEVTAMYKASIYTIIVQTDGTPGAEVKNINTLEQGTILTYPVAYNDPFYGEFNALAPEGYELVRWENDMKGDGALLIVDIDHVTKNVTFTAVFVPKKFTLTYFAGPGGSISGPTPQIINHGQDGKPVTAVPDIGHHFVNWSDGSVMNPRVDLDVTADITVTANFESNELKIYGNVEFMPLWDKTSVIPSAAKPVYGEPFIGVEIVVVDPGTNQVIEHLGVYTDDQGYFEFYRPIHWRGALAIYRPATGEVLGYHTLLGGGYPVIEDLTEDFLVQGPLSWVSSWITGYPGMEPHIKGKVIDTSGNPVQGVLVVSNMGPAYSDYTNQAGEYEIVYPIFGVKGIQHYVPDRDGSTCFPKDYYYSVIDRDFLDQDFVMTFDQMNTE